MLMISKLTPFVTKKIKPIKGSFEVGPVDGKAYLARWKAENGED